MYSYTSRPKSGDGDAFQGVKEMGVYYYREHAEHFRSEDVDMLPFAIEMLRPLVWQRTMEGGVKFADTLFSRDAVLPW